MIKKSEPWYIHAALYVIIAILVYVLIRVAIVDPTEYIQNENYNRTESQLRMDNIRQAQILWARENENFSDDLATVHRDVRLSREIRLENESCIRATSQQAISYKESGLTLKELFEKEQVILNKFSNGAPWLGAFLGLSLALALLSLSVRREREDYVPHQGKCYSCGRCFEYCPIHIEKTTAT